MTSSCSDPRPDEVAHVTFAAAELLEVLWGRASTAPVSAYRIRVLFAASAEIHEGDEARGVRSA